MKNGVGEAVGAHNLSKSEAGMEPRGPEGTTEGRDGGIRQHDD
jgi:hypothetical protein